jgi:hypothetical protein
MSTDKTIKVQRPGKTREDKMPVDERPRVKAWHARLKKAQEERAENK